MPLLQRRMWMASILSILVSCVWTRDPWCLPHLQLSGRSSKEQVNHKNISQLHHSWLSQNNVGHFCAWISWNAATNCPNNTVILTKEKEWLHQILVIWKGYVDFSYCEDFTAITIPLILLANKSATHYGIFECAILLILRKMLNIPEYKCTCCCVFTSGPLDGA